MQEGRILLEGTPRSIFERIETVRSAGLDVPKITDLADRLKKRGFSINGLPITRSEMVSALKNIIKYKDVTPFVKKRQQINLNNSSHAKDIITVKDLNYVYMPGTTYEKRP